MDNQNQQAEANEQASDDLTGLIAIVVAWHEANMQMLREMAKIPGDGGISVEYEGERLPMEGDLHKGYLMGITTALGMFGQLPFEPVEMPDEQPTH